MLVLATTLLGCTEQSDDNASYHIVHSSVETAIEHPDRPVNDKALDPKRKPKAILDFFQIKPNQRVLDVMAFDGYYTELVSRTVGSRGLVYMHNNRVYYDYQSDRKVLQRIEDNRLPNVIRWDHELTELALAENSFDRILMMLVLHDIYWIEEQPQQVLKQLFKLLKPGGILGIVDHAAPDGSGSSHAPTNKDIHRIDAGFVRQQLLLAGFEYDDSIDVLHNPDDSRQYAFFDSRMQGESTHRFVMRFRKPLTQPPPAADER